DRVPVSQRRLATGSERDEVHAELREPASFREPALGAIAHPRPVRLRVARSAHLGNRFGIERRQAQRGLHVSFSVGTAETWGLPRFRPGRYCTFMAFRPVRRGRALPPIMSARTRAVRTAHRSMEAQDG